VLELLVVVGPALRRGAALVNGIDDGVGFERLACTRGLGIDELRR
jgi:hypothetical protein